MMVSWLSRCWIKHDVVHDLGFTCSCRDQSYSATAERLGNGSCRMWATALGPWGCRHGELVKLMSCFSLRNLSTGFSDQFVCQARMTAWVQTLNTAPTGVPLSPPYLHVFPRVWLFKWGTPPKEMHGLTLSRWQASLWSLLKHLWESGSTLEADR